MGLLYHRINTSLRKLGGDWVAESCPTRQEYWSRLPCPPLGDLPSSGIKPRSLALPMDSLPSEPPGKLKNAGVGSLCSFSRGSSRPRNRTGVSCIAGGFFTSWATREARNYSTNHFLVIIYLTSPYACVDQYLYKHLIEFFWKISVSFILGSSLFSGETLQILFMLAFLKFKLCSFISVWPFSYFLISWNVVWKLCPVNKLKQLFDLPGFLSFQEHRHGLPVV